MKKISLLFLCLILIIPLSACGGRIPSAKSAQSMSKSFFKSYGKKYKTSLFGQNKIQKLEINRVEELSRFLAAIDAVVNFDNGHAARVLLTAKKTPPLGWDIQSWEMLELR
ncbi:MAG: hypothetical protein HY541_03040 [Deltaproteobacteria bacterium]|nr:hypothetical protein [Deltaproteobacteria bacterium]